MIICMRIEEVEGESERGGGGRENMNDAILIFFFTIKRMLPSATAALSNPETLAISTSDRHKYVFVNALIFRPDHILTH